MKKHSYQEIIQKLAQADEMVRAGKSQVEICEVLGVSVMTFHRWRKLRSRAPEPKQVAAVEAPLEPLLPTAAPMPSVADMRRTLDELTAENRRLRKIVTDLLLEKARVEEQSPVRSANLEHQSH
ncbi:helix-turn-helix domain-containing protein [Bradyrhizobium ontarionense]|uniref:Helix-turn-helix domain-containing protein n=1 Tax=Bradyrhizobium ontarionense TaxID=2898149 RepID=A0ABY3R4J4_9BRAD|nr:helix-turn-helix domain-containing protein [Bradyrhizobium sp. A19]UFZ01845.1 helix-turn-helix domain-containing protein [Bradyrhizobium sp. A19]